MISTPTESLTLADSSPVLGSRVNAARLIVAGSRWASADTTRCAFWACATVNWIASPTTRPISGASAIADWSASRTAPSDWIRPLGGPWTGCWRPRSTGSLLRPGSSRLGYQNSRTETRARCCGPRSRSDQRRGVISADAVGYWVETDRQRPLLCGRERDNRGHALVAGNLAGRVEQYVGGHGPLKVFRGR